MTVPSDLPLKLAENGVNGVGANGLPVATNVPFPSSLPAALTEAFSPPKERADIKTPHLPFGENVGVATGALTAQ